MLALMAQTAPRYPATAAGLALGLAIAVGGLPFVGGPSPVMGAPPIIIAAIVVGALVVAWAALVCRGSRRQRSDESINGGRVLCAA